ncbi:MAG TPA: hypothetical protein P5211_04845, partial [Anaerolineae bacterium]|nr:hypothetical protein [Anaerolineae bacterium]
MQQGECIITVEICDHAGHICHCQNLGAGGRIGNHEYCTWRQGAAEIRAIRARRGAPIAVEIYPVLAQVNRSICAIVKFINGVTVVFQV